MTSQTAKTLHGFVIAVGMGVATAAETRFLLGLPKTAAEWSLLLNTCVAAAFVGGIGWWIRRQPTTPPGNG